jgi:hypothetical protein
VSGALQLGRPAPGTLKASALLVAVVLVAGGIVTAIGGTAAGLVVGLASGSAMTFGTVMSTRSAAAVTLLLGVAAALGAAVSEDPWASGIAVGAITLASAAASTYSSGMLMLAPLITLVFAVSDRGMPWWLAGLWGVIGGLIGLGIAALMRYGKHPPRPLPWAIAWRHAVVLAVAAGGATAVAELLGLQYGFWVAVTMLVALRPAPEERGALVVPRVVGTLLGAVLAALVVLLLPADLVLVAAIGFLVALAAYAMSGNYFLQTLFLTPMLLLFVSHGDDPGATVELTLVRVLFTAIGAVLVVLLVWLMARWDERAGLVGAATGDDG